MKINLYAIKDRATDAYMAPWTAHTHGHATRMFADNINDPQSAASKHPDDYDLWYLGTFDDNTAELQQQPGPDNQDVPRQLALGKNLLVPRT